ncbi:MAG: GNAT family N-acetyltransferase [Candidatus Omnitrophica bacterium]|nr:GNAT family N-acetyltransferase [Candidatus Omnitrophota bacterium]
MLKVEEYRGEDSESVRSLILTILKDEYPFDMNAYADTDINDISGIYGGSENAFFVIRDKGKVVATAGIKRDTEKSALLRRLFVDKAYRKKGLGASLINKAIEFCKSRGYEQIAFRATDRMKDAMHLLEKNGFEKLESLEVSGFHIHRYALTLK